MDFRCVKAGEGDFNGCVIKFILLMTIIIIIHLIITELFFFVVHRRHFSSMMTTRVQKMTHALMYAYFNPSCVKAVGGGLQGLMYKLIILIITRTTAKWQSTVQFIMLRGACLQNCSFNVQFSSSFHHHFHLR